MYVCSEHVHCACELTSCIVYLVLACVIHYIACQMDACCVSNVL